MYTCMSDVATLSRFIATAMLMLFAGVVNDHVCFSCLEALPL